MKAVLDYLKANRKRNVEQLCDYLRIPSVSAQPKHAPDMRACGEWLVKHCRSIGLRAELVATKGHPVVLAKTPSAKKKSPERKHFVVYGHYDVQPPEPFELWESPPFEPRIAGGRIFARGACDNKGQNFAHFKAVEAYLKTGTPLPCDLTFVIEGEEEVGSESLSTFLKSRRKELACEAFVVSDTGMPAKELPALTYALRGIAALEITLRGPARDLHSGVFGGTVDNPAMVLCQMLAQLRDKKGRMTIPGFYDSVEPLTKYERQEMARMPFTQEMYRSMLGVPQLFGEHGFTFLEQRAARPTFEINGLTSGYQGEGSKTIVPSWARAKITMRLVPNQSPKDITQLTIKHLEKLCPPTVTMEITPGHGAEPYVMSPEGPQAKAAMRALRDAFGAEPLLLREGGSIPIVNEFKRILGVDTLLLGLGLPDDNVHSPNEKFELDCFEKGQRMSALLWQELSTA